MCHGSGLTKEKGGREEMVTGSPEPKMNLDPPLTMSAGASAAGAFALRTMLTGAAGTPPSHAAASPEHPGLSCPPRWRPTFPAKLSHAFALPCLATSPCRRSAYLSEREPDASSTSVASSTHKPGAL